MNFDYINSYHLTTLLLTNSINWSSYSRQSLGSYSISALSWMFRKSNIPFNKLLIVSIRYIIKVYGITEGILELDDTENERSKYAKLIHGLAKVTG